MEEFKTKRHAVKKMTRKGLVETDSREGIVKETAEAKSDGRCINEADFVCTIIWYRTQYMNYIILGIVEFMLVGVLAAGAFVLALESEVRNCVGRFIIGG